MIMFYGQCNDCGLRWELGTAPTCKCPDEEQPAQPYKSIADYTHQATNGGMRIDPVTGDVGIGTPFPQPAQQEPSDLDVWKARALQAEAVIEKFMAKQPAQQEPVAWMYQCSADNSGPVLMQHKQDWAKSGSGLWTEAPLYTSPPLPEQEPVELCQYGQEPASCTSNPMDCQCAIDAALAQPEQEPVAWINPDEQNARKAFHWVKSEEFTSPVYTSPPAQRTWLGLTDEERDDLLGTYITADGRAQAIEAKLKEKNT